MSLCSHFGALGSKAILHFRSLVQNDRLSMGQELYLELVVMVCPLSLSPVLLIFYSERNKRAVRFQFESSEAISRQPGDLY